MASSGMAMQAAPHVQAGQQLSCASALRRSMHTLHCCFMRDGNASGQDLHSCPCGVAPPATAHGCASVPSHRQQLAACAGSLAAQEQPCNPPSVNRSLLDTRRCCHSDVPAAIEAF